MSRRKWISASGKDKPISRPSDEELEKLGNEEIVVLLTGFNNFGDKIYNYIKLEFKQYYPLKEAIRKGGKFDVREFGEVLAAGQGEPPDDVKAEMESQYKMINFQSFE